MFLVIFLPAIYRSVSRTVIAQEFTCCSSRSSSVPNPLPLAEHLKKATRGDRKGKTKTKSGLFRGNITANRKTDLEGRVRRKEDKKPTLGRMRRRKQGGKTKSGMDKENQREEPRGYEG